MSYSESSAGFHTLIVDNILQQTAELYFIIQQNEIRPIYRGTEEDQVELIQGGNVETRTSKPSRINGMEESLTTFIEINSGILYSQ